MTADGPPQRPPFHAQPIGGDDCYLEPAEMLDVLASLLGVSIELAGPWIVGGWEVSVTAIRRRDYGQPFAASFNASRNGVLREVTLDLFVHPSGWIDACLTVSPDAQRHFFIERIYEEFEIWPPGSPCAAAESGRMGKRCGWIQLEAQHWPDLAFLAEGRFVTVEPRDQVPFPMPTPFV